MSPGGSGTLRPEDTHRVAGSSSVGIRPASLDIHEAADAHAAIQHLETEPGVEGFEAGVTAEVNHVEGVEPSKEAAHEFGSDPLMLILRQHLQQRDALSTPSLMAVANPTTLSPSSANSTA